jgi:hypothetical protein
MRAFCWFEGLLVCWFVGLLGGWAVRLVALAEAVKHERDL